MIKSEQLFGRAKKLLPGGVNSPVRFYEPYPFFATSARGSKLTTADHKTYLDYCMGYGAMILGHSYSSVIEAVRSQLDNGTLFCVPTEREIKLAEMICKVVPCAEMTRLVNTGSEATMHAIRLARAFTKRKGVIKFEGGYHGAHDYVLAKAGSGAASIPASEGVLEEASARTAVVAYNDPAALEQAIEKNRDTACVIMEPVLANIGLVPPEKRYLNEVRKITEQNDVVLIFDEVVTGFRLELGGAGEFFGIKPDLATFAKALGNGLPIAAIGGRKEIMSRLAPSGPVYQASTFAGNPVSVAAAIATLESLIEAKNAIYPKIARTCDSIVNGIKDMLSSANLDCTLNSIGSMFQLFFTNEKVKDDASARKSNTAMFRKLFDELIKRDVFIPPSQFETCFVSYAHNEDDTDKTIEAYGEAFRRIKK
ncbi:MAG: glutamate-1-semialdehyde-2,1-aminomutase [Thaumarchaeota archaeon 13_1_40CM_3_50_5]|nr:MAG: glutamate-1-semialdehyde-2,1-aminomutase [Thaumarchaeota archaeon 13_1_40CM_3_50_5]